MNLKIKTQKSLRNLDYFGTVLVSFGNDLKTILGDPSKQVAPNRGYEWYRETSLGDPFVIMDKGDVEITDREPIPFYIMARTEEIAVKAMREILEEGERLGIE